MEDPLDQFRRLVENLPPHTLAFNRPNLPSKPVIRRWNIKLRLWKPGDEPKPKEE